MYEEVWGGMISRGVDDDADFDPGANFGFVTYNDHHFHLGYWVYAMAYYAQFYPDWATGSFPQYVHAHFTYMYMCMSTYMY